MLHYYLALRSTQKSLFKRDTPLVPFKTWATTFAPLFVNFLTNQFKKMVLHQLCNTIGLKKTSRHVFIQSEVERKPIVTRSHSFSHALRQLHVITLIGSLDCLRSL